MCSWAIASKILWCSLTSGWRGPKRLRSASNSVNTRRRVMARVSGAVSIASVIGPSASGGDASTIGASPGTTASRSAAMRALRAATEASPPPPADVAVVSRVAAVTPFGNGSALTRQRSHVVAIGFFNWVAHGYGRRVAYRGLAIAVSWRFLAL